ALRHAGDLVVRERWVQSRASDLDGGAARRWPAVVTRWASHCLLRNNRHRRNLCNVCGGRRQWATVARYANRRRVGSAARLVLGWPFPLCPFRPATAAGVL